MHVSNIQLLEAQLWDLRSLCEQKLRLLTDVQRLLAQYLTDPERSVDTKRHLVAALEHVVDLDRDAVETGDRCRYLALRLADPQR